MQHLAPQSPSLMQNWQKSCGGGGWLRGGNVGGWLGGELGGGWLGGGLGGRHPTS